MPRFYFHLYNSEVTCDREGQELAGIDAARAVAVASARDMASAGVLEGRLNLTDRIEVQDETGDTVCTVHFRDVVTVES